MAADRGGREALNSARTQCRRMYTLLLQSYPVRYPFPINVLIEYLGHSMRRIPVPRSLYSLSHNGSTANNGNRAERASEEASGEQRAGEMTREIGRCNGRPPTSEPAPEMMASFIPVVAPPVPRPALAHIHIGDGANGAGNVKSA